MKAQSSGIRVEQWSAADAQGHRQQSLDGRSSTPSLLETLRAAAAAAEEKAKTKAPKDEKPAAASRAQAAQDQPSQKAPTSQISDETQFAAEVQPARNGKSSLQGLSVKRNVLKHKPSLPGPDSPSTPCSLNAQARQRMIHKARTELRTLEESVPWEAVHDSWKECRQPWRKALRQAETLPELLNALNDLRKALAIEKSQFSTQGAEWEEQMRRCIESNASIEDVLQLLSELRVSAKQWNKPKQKEPVAAVDCSKDQKAVALQGLEALWRATQNGSSALMQCPLEAILDYDLDVLKFLRQLLEKEMCLLAGNGKDTSKMPAASVFAQLQPKAVKLNRYSPFLGTSSSGETRCEARIGGRRQQ